MLAGEDLALRDTSTGAVSSRLWDLGVGRRRRASVLRHAWSEPGYYRVTLQVSGQGGESTTSRTVLVRPANASGRCEPGGNVRCLLDDRYAVRLRWFAGDGSSGEASVVHEGPDDSGLFRFFDANNWEALVKVLDGCKRNGHVWVFAASTTDLGYEIEVVDTLGADPPGRWRNEPGMPAPSLTDTKAFPGGCAP